MPNSINFRALDDAEVTKALGKAKTFEANQPKKIFTSAELKTKFSTWQKSQKAPEEKVVLNKISAAPLTEKVVNSIRAINESITPTAEAVVAQKMGPDEVVNALFSSLTTLEYTKMESEYKSRLKAAGTNAVAKAQVQKEWAQIVKAGQQAFSAGGLKNVKEADLKKFSQELTNNKANFTTITNIANSAVAVQGLAPVALTAATALKAGFVPVTGVQLDGPVSTEIRGLCDQPFAQGSFTKHFHKGFNLVVRIPYWCPTWKNPFKVCHKNVTLAGLSLDIDLSVGYKVSCCGAVAWGQGSVQVCGSVVGITFCAGCTARIVGVAGVGRTTTGSKCVYGIGINAQLTCKFGAITVLNVSVPFGYNVTGPCPPAGLCK